jgi:hypothetical protein
MGHSDAVGDEKANQRGIAVFISKPYQKQDFTKTIRLIWDKNNARRHSILCSGVHLIVFKITPLS